MVIREIGEHWKGPTGIAGEDVTDSIVYGGIEEKQVVFCIVRSQVHQICAIRWCRA